MTAEAIRVLFASRAHESAHTEGGFVLLQDLAGRAAEDPATEPAVFSTARVRNSSGGMNFLPAFGRGGWGMLPAVQFARALHRTASDFDIVHTAHVPTSLNTSVLRHIRGRPHPGGARFVQTITALPERNRVRESLFWGDAIVCLNDSTASEARQFHDTVLTIAPIARPDRLQRRVRMPAEVRDRFADHKVACIPVDLARVGDFDLQGLCESLLHARTDLAVVFACRFGEEQLARELLAAISQSQRDRAHVFATIDWMLDLLAASKVVVYPIADVRKKFNPPLVLLEAAQLGSRIVTTSSILLDSLVSSGGLAQVASSEINDWTTAICEMIDRDGRTDGAEVSFDDVYSQYVDLYRTLLKHSDS